MSPGRTSLRQAQGTALGTALHRGKWELAALALLLAAAQALESLPPQAATGLVEALSDGEVWQLGKAHPRPRTGQRRPRASTPEF